MQSIDVRKRILISDPLDKSAVAELKKEFEVVEKHYSPDELKEEIGKFHGIIVRSATKLTEEIINNGTQLEVVGRAGIGVDNINVKAALKKGILVVNAPGSSSVSVAELTMAFMLALCSKLVHVTNKTKTNTNPKKKIGKIGKEVITRANIFGMRCLVYSPNSPSEVSAGLDVERTDDLEYLLRISDYVTIHTKLKPETHNLIGKRELELMKPTAYLINCARGGIVDEEALYIALNEGKIAGAALDVYADEPVRDNKLFDLDNIYASPHIGASTIEAQERVGRIIINQVRKVLKGLQPDFVVKDSYFTG
ncbi:MAG: hydroxyacid dehydrogenase [Candidatus Hodarchaeales archaeon]|jgi:D-3-phosphoglycerate dehydrogenase